MTYKVSAIPSDLFSDSRANIRRLKTDNELTSFRDNRQFRFFDRVNVPDTTGSQLVYRVTIGTNFNLLSRIISLYIGGLSYSVYPCACSAIFTGTLTDVSNKIFPNNTVLREGLSVHPGSLNSIEKATGTNIFDVNGAQETVGTDVFAGRNAQASRTNTDADNIKLGYAQENDVWIVFNPLDEVTTDSKGTFSLLWEEL